MTDSVALLPDGAYYGALQDQLRAAKKSVLVSMFLMSPKWYDRRVNIMRELCDVAKRGLQCKIILSSAPLKIGRRRPNQEAAQELSKSGWEVRIMTGGHTLHEKVIILDETTLFFGSHNLAWSSVSSNFELSAMVIGKDVTLQATRIFWQRWSAGINPKANEWELQPALVMPLVP